jgi:hypothetical protein
MKIGARILGSMAIGSAISGAVGGYQCYSCAEDTQAPTKGKSPARADAKGNQQHVSYDQVSPPQNLPHKEQVSVQR